MPQYMLLLFDISPTFAQMSPEEMQKATEKYMGWMKRSVAGQRLMPEPIKVMHPKPGGQPSVTDGPYSETKEVLGGFYVIEAESFDAAVEKAMDCPHLEYGGTIEVRQVYQRE